MEVRYRKGPSGRSFSRKERLPRTIPIAGRIKRWLKESEELGQVGESGMGPGDVAPLGCFAQPQFRVLARSKESVDAGLLLVPWRFRGTRALTQPRKSSTQGMAGSFARADRHNCSRAPALLLGEAAVHFPCSRPNVYGKISSVIPPRLLTIV